MMGLALSNFVHRADQAMIQKKLGDFASQGKKWSSSGGAYNCTAHHNCNSSDEDQLMCC